MERSGLFTNLNTFTIKEFYETYVYIYCYTFKLSEEQQDPEGIEDNEEPHGEEGNDFYRSIYLHKMLSFPF